MLFKVTSWALLSAFTQPRLTDVHCASNSQKANKRLLSLRVPSLPLSHSIEGQRTKRGVWRRDFRRWKQRFVSLKLLLKKNYVSDKKDRTINASNLIKTKAEQFVRKHLMSSLFSLLDYYYVKFDLSFRYCPVRLYFAIWFDQELRPQKLFLVDYSTV